MTKKVKDLVLTYLRNSKKQTFSIEQLAESLNFQKSFDFKMLVQTIAQMEREGTIVFSKKGKVKLSKKNNILTGTFRANERGFGFVSIDDEEDDVFIPKGMTNFALEGDTVNIDILKSGNPIEGQAAEGKVINIQKRGYTQLVGIFTKYSEKERNESGLYGVVIPKDKKISMYKVFIAAEGIEPEDGSVVLVEITHYPEVDYTASFEGLVKNVIGHKNDPGMDILSIVLQLGIPIDFESETLAEAEQLADSVSPEEIEGRRDLRDKDIVTIDGAEAKDLDDAVRVEKQENGNYLLGVYIADVSHYVTETSALDLEAEDRATSVYLTDRVIPMLPRKLSNGICSLNPKVDRLVMSCEMEITPDGEVIHYDIFEGVIHSKARMTYQAVNEILEKSNPETLQEYADFVSLFETMAELHHILEEKRMSRGAISFDSREAQIVVDTEGHPQDIILRTRGTAERLIESFMLAANETVARHYYRQDLPFIYRIHEQPKEEKVQRFFEFITNFGIIVKGEKDSVEPKELQSVLDKAAGLPEEPVINMMLLRSMQQAKYSENPVGHYGLAADDYTHFTSPIRRYPDLLVHRLIKTYNKQPVSQKTKNKWEGLIPDIADHSSKMERRAVEAERETDKMKKAEFMQGKIGEEYDGVITSITKFGMFIELDNTVEGLIHVNQLKDDYYHFIESHLALVGERTGTVYKIGQSVTVKVAKADAETREIDFELLCAETIKDAQLLLRKPKKDSRNHKNSRSKEISSRHQNSSNRKNKKNKSKGKNGKQPFYKKVAKKSKGKKKKK
ncbi:ribonuclease R [Vagococcus vulneris]|uniref:Ribonuclease R n=1 Tax=Vagococcus vulneris TaxID=1977869 RepID=A0A430A1D5_9ENTE|nr:ribonuclease R [Vagococcus vulneris]RSU00206.1 ribonuclease R [Vagococcus vulneris]